MHSYALRVWHTFDLSQTTENKVYTAQHVRTPRRPCLPRIPVVMGIHKKSLFSNLIAIEIETNLHKWPLPNKTKILAL
jgi:hypothetical protein